MAALDFPSDPVDAELYDAPNGVRYKWSEADGLWTVAPADAVEEPIDPPPETGGGGGVGAVSASGDAFSWIPNTNVDVVIQFPTAISGNAGGWLATTGVYTPPAGSYFIQCTCCVQAPTGGNGTWSLTPRKNGVRIPNTGAGSSGGPQFMVPITAGVYVEANGTDTFDFVAQTMAAGMYPQGHTFTAFPLWVAP